MKARVVAAAVSVLALGALARVLQKDPEKPLGLVDELKARLVLTWRFWLATDVDGLIQQVEFDFVYLDGESSPHTKVISSLSVPLGEQPDRLVRQPMWMISHGFAPFKPEERIAMALARADRNGHAAARGRAEIVDSVCRVRNLSIRWSGLAPKLTDIEQGRAVRAYQRTFETFPEWPIPDPAFATVKADGPMSS